MNYQELSKATMDVVTNMAGIETLMVMTLSHHFFGKQNEDFVKTYYPAGKKSKVVDDFFQALPDGDFQRRVNRIRQIRNIFAHSVFSSDGPPNEADVVRLARMEGPKMETHDPDDLYAEYKQIAKEVMPKLQEIAEKCGLKFEPLKR